MIEKYQAAEKKKNWGNNRRKIILRILWAMSIISLMCLSSLLMMQIAFFPGKIDAHIHLHQMRFWGLPSNSAFVDLSIHDGAGGASTCFTYATLIIDSTLSLDDVKLFYSEHYYPPYYATPYYQPPIFLLDTLPDGRNRYKILAEKSWRC